MYRKLLPTSILSASAASLMLLAACGSPAVAPAVKLGAATQPQAAASAAATSSGAASAPAASQPAAPASASPQPSSSSADTISGAGASSGATITLNSSDASAQYQTQEQLAGHNLPNMAVGKTIGVSGSIVLTASGQPNSSASKITVDLTSLQSDESMRDKFIKGNTLQTSQYPDAVFVPSHIDGLPAVLPTSGGLTFQLVGNLTVHGVTKPVTWTVVAQFNGSRLSGKATAPFTITEFGMSLPKAGPVLSVQDAGTLELDLNSAPIAGGASA